MTEALKLDGPSVIRFPKTPARGFPRARWVGPPCPLHPHRATARSASWQWERCSPPRSRRPTNCVGDGIEATVWDVRVVSDPIPAMLADAAGHQW